MVDDCDSVVNYSFSWAMALLYYERYSVEENLIERVLNLCLADLAEIKSKAGAW